MITALFFLGGLITIVLISAIAASLMDAKGLFPWLAGALTALLAIAMWSPRPVRNRSALLLMLVGLLTVVAFVYIIIAQTLIYGLLAIAKFGVVEFLTGTPPTSFSSRGGVGPQLLGTLYMTLIGAALGILFGLPAGVYIGEFKGDLAAKVARLGVNVVVEFPTITIGLFVYALSAYTVPFVNAYIAPLINEVLRPWGVDFRLQPFSGLAGAIALSIIMIPYVALFTAAAYASIPQHVREAAYAMTGSLLKTLFVVLRKAAWRAIQAAMLLGTAKIAGETAPLMFTAFGNNFYTSATFGVDLTQPTGSLTLLIYYMAQTPYSVQNDTAWGAAALLLIIVLVLFALSRSQISK